MKMELIASAILGGLIAFAIRAVFEVLDVKRKRAAKRVDVVLQLSGCYFEYRSELEVLFQQRQMDPRQSWSPQLTKLHGRLVELQVKLWDAFTDRKIRGGIVRLVSRLEKTKELFSGEPLPVLEVGKRALAWNDEGFDELFRIVAERARLPLRDAARLVFVRVGKATSEDHIQLSFEDGPPPWEFGIVFEANDQRNDEEKRNLHQVLCSKYGALRCRAHFQPIHLTVARDHSLGVAACCEEFGREVMGILARKASSTS